jgi:hypothetical protein
MYHVSPSKENMALCLCGLHDVKESGPHSGNQNGQVTEQQDFIPSCFNDTHVHVCRTSTRGYTRDGTIRQSVSIIIAMLINTELYCISL